jgi:hypothetical protein
MDEKDKDPVVPAEDQETLPDENMGLFIYGNIKIRDVDTGELLINMRV